MPTKVIIGDDHKMIRDGLKALIEGEPGMQVVAEADNGKKAVELANKHCPDVIVMDIGMPELNGIEATRQILGLNTNTKIIGLSMYSDQRFVLEMLKAGARAYLVKDSAFDELNQAIRAVLMERTYISPSVSGRFVDEYKNNQEEEDTSAYSVLTEREREVLQQLAEGKTTKNAAANLYVSVKTIETHRSHIMNKLGIRSIAELTKYAVREGLTTLE